LLGSQLLRRGAKKQIPHPAKGAGIRDDSCSVPIAALGIGEGEFGVERGEQDTKTERAPGVPALGRNFT